MNSIYRRALFVLIALASFSTLQAKVVDRSEALETATTFLRSHSSVAVLSASNVKEVWNSNQLSAAGVATASATSAPTFYVFAPETGTGFVIVSGDDATESILGYSDESAFVTEDMPCTFLSWCEAMDNQITYYRQTGTVSARKTARENGVATLASSSLLLETASWNQTAPYYNDCPKDGSSRSVTGCVPTSLAIAMRYHQHPTTGTGKTEAYTTETKGISVASRDLSSHTYNWSNMPLSYSGSYTSTQASAVATLMADIGAALKADYTSGSTGASTSAAVMYENFGYSSKMAIIEASSYSDDEWTALMEDQIKNVGPVPYVSDEMVHQFILDGYNTSDQFHINWGWGGSQDGYFYLPDIVSGSDTQRAVLNFYPDDGSAAECTLTLYGDISTDATILHQNGEFTMNSVYVGNKSPLTFVGKIAYVLTDSEGNIKEHISGDYNITSDWGLNYFVGIPFIEAPCAIESELQAGDCIRMAYQNSGYDDWKLVRANGDDVTDAITITSSMIGEPVEFQYSVLMYDVGLTTNATTFAKNAHFTVNAEIVNNSLTDITDGYLIVGLCDSEGNVKEWISDERTLSLGLGIATVFDDQYGNSISCVIRGDIEDNDRIRMFYQVGSTSEDHWKLIEPDTSYGDPPYEIVISASQIGDPVSSYDLLVYEAGVTVSRNTFYTGAAFTTNVECANFGDSEIPVILKVALVGGDGEVKEWISDIVEDNLGSMRYHTYSISCTITGDVEAGDIIRPYYQDDTENWWALGENGDSPTEVVLTADMISSVPVSPYNITVIGDGVTVSKETFYTGAAFNTNVNFESWEGNVSVKIKVAHVGSDGEVKEWISDEKDCGTANSGSQKSSGDIICSILEDVEAGDIIRPYYQGNSDGEWWTFGEYENVPYEVEITEDKISERPEEKSYNVIIYNSDPLTTADYFYPGVTFTVNATIYNFSDAMEICVAKVALTDSDGNIKEFLSEGEIICPFNNGWGGLSNVQCTITGDVKAGDRIRVYYQADNYDTWHVMGEYYGSAWEYVITLDMVDDTLYEFVANNWLSPDLGRVTADDITYDDETNTITVVATGTNNVALGNSLTQSEDASSITTANYVVGSDQCCFIVVGSDLSTASGDSKLWWMNGYNGGMEIAPTKTKKLTDGEVLFLWDLSESEAGTNMPSEDKYLDGWTAFGLTSTTGTSVISDIAFYSWEEAEEKYPELVTTRVIEDGDYLIVDAEGNYLGGGLTWGTQAATIGKPQFIGFEMQEDFTYHLDSHQYNSATDHYLGANLYFDNGTPVDWTLEEVEGGYTIYGTGESGTGYLTSNGFQTAATLEETPYVWTLLTKDDVIASMSEATTDVPVDVTALIAAPELKRNSNSSYYPTWTATNVTFGGGSAVANCAEAYHTTFSASQEITLPLAGYYSLSAKGFYRDDSSTTLLLPVLYAGEESVEFPELNTSANTMAEAYAEFLEGMHQLNSILIEAEEDGETVTIGFKGEDTSLWNIFGELELLYYGTEEPVLPEGTVHECVAEFDHWSISGNTGGSFQRNTWSTEADPSGMTTPFIEYWVGAGNQLSDATISHTQLTEMTAGYYEVSIFARAFNEQSLVDISEGITFSANSQSMDLNKETHATFDHVSAEEYGTYKVYCQVGSDGKLDIDLTLKSVNCDWLAFKDLQVVHLGSSLTDLPELAAAEGTMNSSIEAAQTEALSAYASSATLANYNAAYQAVECAQVSVTFYAGVAATLEELDLDEVGMAKFEELTGWSNQALEYQDMTDIFIAAVEAQTTPGSDMTYAMENNGEYIAEQGNGPGSYSSGLATETYIDSGEATAGTVLSYSVTGLSAGTYEVSFYATANMANGVSGDSGTGISQVYANDATAELTVGTNSAAQITSLDDMTLYTLTCTVGDDGILEFGIQNVADGGNWFLCAPLSLTLVSVPIEIEWTMTEAGWGTLILPFDAEVPDGLTAYAGDAITVSGSEVEPGDAAESIEANVPYLVKGEEGTYSFSGVATNTEDSYTVGVLTGTFVDMTYEDFTPNSGQYVLQNQTDKGIAFYQITENSEGLKITPYHCYLTYTGAEPTALSLPGMATGISAVEGDLIANDAIYDLSGRKVSKTVKGGVYIINGKKVLVK